MAGALQYTRRFLRLWDLLLKTSIRPWYILRRSSLTNMKYNGKQGQSDMGSGSNSHPVNIFCVCHGQQKMAQITPGQGIEVVSRHHGAYHTGSLSVRELLHQISGTTDGSAIITFVQQMVGSG